MAHEVKGKRTKPRSASTGPKAVRSQYRPVPASVAKKQKRKSRPPKSARAVRPAEPAAKSARSGYGVSVTLQMPAMHLPPKVASKIQAVKLPEKITSRLPPISRRTRRIMTCVLIVAVLLMIGFGVRGGSRKIAVKTNGVVAERTAPDFKPLVPSSAESSATTYDGKRNMVSYSATFSGARLTVSQQPLPPKFTQDPKALSVAADSIHAKQRLDTAKGPLYIATNETNDQLAVFAGKQVLLFIHSDRKLDDASWKAFIELLHEKS